MKLGMELQYFFPSPFHSWPRDSFPFQRLIQTYLEFNMSWMYETSNYLEF